MGDIVVLPTKVSLMLELIVQRGREMGNGLVSQDYVENIFSIVIYLYIRKRLLRMREIRQKIMRVKRTKYLLSLKDFLSTKQIINI